LAYLRVFNKGAGSPSDFVGSVGADKNLADGGVGQIFVGPGGVGLHKGLIGVSAQFNLPQTAGTIVAYQTADFSPTDSVEHNFMGIGDFTFVKYLDNNWYAGWAHTVDNRAKGAASGGWSAGETFSIALTWGTSVGTTLYTKGVQRLFGAGDPSPYNTGADNIGIGGKFSGSGAEWNTNIGSGAMYYFAVWDRVLRPEEVQILENDPYCFLISDLEAEWTAGPAMSALYGAVRSAAATTTNQKVYVEFVEDTLIGRADFGFATSGPDLEANYPGINSPSRGFFFRGLGQFICVDSADHAAATPVYTTGNNVGIAFNTQTGRAWVRVNGGAWSNGGDPAAGTGGFSIPFAGPYYAIFHASTVNDKCTAKFSSSSWTYAAPSGYTQLA